MAFSASLVQPAITSANPFYFMQQQVGAGA
jgi:hypothetical protein